MLHRPTQLIALVSLAGLALPAAAHATGFEELLDWPFIHSGSSNDGGMMVNMDADPELELVQVTGSAGVGGQVHVYNYDGTTVPGWPASFSDGPFSAPAFGDIDGDGEGEVVVHSFFFGLSAAIWAFNLDGSVVSGFPVEYGGPMKAPALADLDGDGDLEIISTMRNGGGGDVYVFQGDGSLLDGWPAAMDVFPGSGPAVADVNGDGKPEIFACSYYQIHGFDPTGKVLPGFPYDPPGSETFNYTTPVLADLDKDGDLEILAGSNDEDSGAGQVNVLHHDGTEVAGWPKTMGWSPWAPVSVADIDGDGWLDVATGETVLSPDPANQIYAWDRTGKLLPGFPFGPIDAIHTQLMIADIDNDGMVELLYDQNLPISNLEAINHDGTPVSGWPLEIPLSSFTQTPQIGDFNNDGFIDIAMSGNGIADGVTALDMFTSFYPWDPALAPLATYQYNVQRTGAVGAAAPACPGDLDGDGDTDLSDLGILLAAFEVDGGGDLDGDGDTDLSDLGTLLADFGCGT
jgi:hypothetical protein